MHQALLLFIVQTQMDAGRLSHVQGQALPPTSTAPVTGLSTTGTQETKYPCSPNAWGVRGAEVQCGSIGGEQGLVVKDKGAWSHAWQEVPVQVGGVYEVSGMFYAESLKECDAAPPVMWCSPSMNICSGGYREKWYCPQGGCPACLVGVSAEGEGMWEPFSRIFVPQTQLVTMYLPQEATAYSSWIRDIRLKKVIEYNLSCLPEQEHQWSVKNAQVECGVKAGQNGLVVKNAPGSWSHAWQEVHVQAGAVYEVSGMFYAESANECDTSAQVTFCSPSLNICPGGYSETFYEVGGSLVGLSPEGEGKWEPFKAQFRPSVLKVTLYLAQEGTKYSSWFKDLRMKLIHDAVGTYTRTHAPTRTCMHAHTHEPTRACMHTRMNPHSLACTHACMHACVCAYVHACTILQKFFCI